MSEQPTSQLNKQSPVINGKKNKKLIGIVIVVVILFAGGVYLVFGRVQSNSQGQVAGANQGSLAQNSRQISQNGDFFPQFQGVTTTADELIIGSQVVVFGTSNSDGSLTAQRVRLGDFNEEEFQGFANRRLQAGATTTEPDGVNQTQNFLPPAGLDPQEFQGLSAEERRQRFQELRESGQLPDFGNTQGSGFRGGQAGAGIAGSPRFGETGRPSGAESVRGEVLKKDDVSLTVKLSDGGSRLVFYSDKTIFTKADTATTTVPIE